MKIHMQVNDGVAVFTIPEHDDQPEKTVLLSDYPSGSKIRKEVMTWASGYGATESVGF
jgi:hypothetical protein